MTNQKQFVKAVRVVHDSYGCESGCCGHKIYGYDEDEKKIWTSEFHFLHPYGDDTNVFINEMVHDEFPNGIPIINFDDCCILDD